MLVDSQIQGSSFKNKVYRGKCREFKILNDMISSSTTITNCNKLIL